MSRLEEAVRHDLDAAPAPPPLERLHRRARRRRVRRVGAALVPIAVVSLAVVVTVRVVQPTRALHVAPSASPTSTTPTTVTTTVTTTTRPSGPTLPYATEARFPGLADVLRQAHEYELSSGPVSGGEIVATTRDKTYGLFGGPTAVEKTPVYVVRLVGSFICNSCSIPLGAAAPHGTQILFTRIPSEPGLGSFSVGNAHTDLSQFGTVYRLPQPREALPSGRTTFENRTVVLTPDSSVAEGQSIQVTVTGFGVGDRVWLSECASADDATASGCGPQLLQDALVVRGDGRAGPAAFVAHDHAPFAPGPDATTLKACSNCVVVATVGDDGFVFAPFNTTH